MNNGKIPNLSLTFCLQRDSLDMIRGGTLQWGASEEEVIIPLAGGLFPCILASVCVCCF